MNSPYWLCSTAFHAKQDAEEDEEDDATMIEGIEAQIADEQRDFAAFSARVC